MYTLYFFKIKTYLRPKRPLNFFIYFGDLYVYFQNMKELLFIFKISMNALSTERISLVLDYVRRIINLIPVICSLYKKNLESKVRKI